MRLRLLAPIITGIVIIALLLFGISQCEKKNEYRDQAFSAESGARKIEVRENARISVINDSLATIKRERDNYKAEYLKASKALKTVESRRTKKYTQAKVAIKPISDSISSVKAFEIASDSLLSVKDSIILVEQRNNLVQFKSFSDEINKLHGVIESETLKTDAWRESSISSERKYQKEKSKDFSVGPYLGYGVSKDGFSPSVGVSVQWRVIKFGFKRK